MNNILAKVLIYIKKGETFMSQKFINKQAIWMLLVLLINFLVSPVTSVMAAAHPNNLPDPTGGNQGRTGQLYQIEPNPNNPWSQMAVYIEGTKIKVENWSFCINNIPHIPQYLTYDK